MKTETCINQNRSVACKVFHRLALMIKMEHALNMCILFPFTYNYVHCRSPTNKITDIDSQSLFPVDSLNQRTNGPVNAHLISWPSKAQNIQNLENIW